MGDSNARANQGSAPFKKKRRTGDGSDAIGDEVKEILEEKPEEHPNDLVANSAAVRTEARVGQFMDNFIPDDVFSPTGGRTIAIVGEKQQGKSNLVWVLALHAGMQFAETWVITQSTDGELANLVNRPCMVLNAVTEAFFDELIMRQEAQPKPARKSILLIFDDFIGTDFDFKSSRAMRVIASRNRHLRISVIFSTQKFREMPDIFRKNAQWWFFGKNVLSSIKQITEELATVQLEPKRMRHILGKIAAAESFQFLGMKNVRPSAQFFFRPPHMKPETDDEGSDSDDDGSGSDSDEGEGSNDERDQPVAPAVKSQADHSAAYASRR